VKSVDPSWSVNSLHPSGGTCFIGGVCSSLEEDVAGTDPLGGLEHLRVVGVELRYLLIRDLDPGADLSVDQPPYQLGLLDRASEIGVGHAHPLNTRLQSSAVTCLALHLLHELVYTLGVGLDAPASCFLGKELDAYDRRGGGLQHLLLSRASTLLTQAGGHVVYCGIDVRRVYRFAVHRHDDRVLLDRRRGWRRRLRGYDDGRCDEYGGKSRAAAGSHAFPPSS